MKRKTGLAALAQRPGINAKGWFYSQPFRYPSTVVPARECPHGYSRPDVCPHCTPDCRKPEPIDRGDNEEVAHD